ncbi:MAG TPA: hypothetical protein VGQ09_08715 [Chitinophagaceae bacterium]|jgi:hypothetical protein|nr:hypothetical protein [Chitinophagaceae bacterium]
MKKILGRLPALTLLILGCVLFTGCGKKTVKIKYQHYLSFGSAQDKNGNLIEAGQGQFFALFYILCIDNTAANAKSFSFDPNKFYTNDPGETIANALNSDFGLKNPITVAAGQKKSNLGIIIFKMKGSWGGNQGETLYYNSSAGESVLPWKDNWVNLGGPQAHIADYLGFPVSYSSGANLCVDNPIQSPH